MKTAKLLQCYCNCWNGTVYQMITDPGTGSEDGPLEPAEKEDDTSSPDHRIDDSRGVMLVVSMRK
jgi:hypothetical protein